MYARVIPSKTPACNKLQQAILATSFFINKSKPFMLQELFDLVKNVAGQTVTNNPDVPNEKNEEVIAEATNTVASGLRNVVAGGGVQNIINMFGGGQGGRGMLSNPLVSMMIGHFANKLMNKYGMGMGQANNLATGLIPSVLENLVNRTNDPADQTFTLDNLLNSITGGQSTQVVQQKGAGSITDILGQLSGGQTSGGNGSGGLMDIVTQLAQGAQSEQQKNGGSLVDLIKGFTGR
jgi:uncharacterized membrane protein YeaQ/YmgE (transglycosylase-associated protein family)